MTLVGEETFDIELAEWLTKKENLPKNITIKINRETDKAVYVDQVIDGEVKNTLWLPKSAIKYL
jgi:hypothetical protein